MQKKRWETAQNYEKAWWESRTHLVEFDFYRAYANELLQQTRTIFTITPGTSILEIGSGAGGIITYLNSNDRWAIDPLEDFYATVPEFCEQRDQKVTYQTARAEDLPFADQRFDFIICDNVLDHCDDIQKVFSEMSRVLRNPGYVYLRLNLYTSWGKIVRVFVEKMKIDPGHPHTFTNKSIRTIIKSASFEITTFQSAGFFRNWMKEITSGKIKEIVKALTLSTPNKTTFVLKSRSPHTN
ncbi:class I SAM-dependent methyltransferase [candidate division KSB1 bacterium]|nr:class I SAM-dependent methyltransferase [candidate division KSB1 bacterium]RQW05195.1 MAG: class I SAM-dependent methyltransferase [candidate division KSB1 bacterium]